MTADDVTSLIHQELATETTQWNLGTFGAIAEFLRDPSEPVELGNGPGRLFAVTNRGGIGFDDLSRVRLFASETAVGQGWSHRVALCLPEAACAMNRRTALTELGPDAAALRLQDRGGILFDMGLGTLPVDICIRTGDPELIASLRTVAGRSLFEAGNPAMGAIIAKGPHRVFVTRAGRCEVYQPIPPADGKSPEGPHTHVLPQLLRNGRTHAATEPVPNGWVPFAHLIPTHPLKDAMARPRPWDGAAHEHFQALLAVTGDPELMALKQGVLEAIRSGSDPAGFREPANKFARHTLRVTLRQLRAGPPLPGLSRWLETFDRQEPASEDGADAYGHA
ncbi:conserved hypothetical protein [Bosea sp. 62]|uniref:DUF6925 family protein n=1 Tax=unclassified Bosea (in: a-proteobacteria) TaxID=2653178 RepID=UPI001255A388|nr:MULTISPECIES: hypothetical protein [unclassified Bosea (in: a-proteobacteria)]CAD5253434.1 conserved hypothetical protein [Bosea sp. 7B]CAD5277855.1 conserved hypothetical protein [Bosea sp. 21B]CAD5278876.1 conserved hypothetical protein [Bosea sp. 46]VVT59723.1 conserved hypothetical protein [Bosea sp. EC-HK365B]VXB40894.1 conserved hypothetical protein [Bosea sp. 62]